MRTLKGTLSLKTLRIFRILNDFCPAKTLFCFLVTVCDRVGDGEIFSFKNLGLGSPHTIIT